MRTSLIILFAFCYAVTTAQTTGSSEATTGKLVGIWGMFKDRHPDGWGTFNPPYMYFEFKEGNQYNRIWLHRKGNSMVFGEYEVVGDSLIVFHESMGTNGKDKGKVRQNTVKLQSVQSDLLEIWEDWDRVLGKRVKKFGHKQKYRPLTIPEKEKLVAAKTQLMNDYAFIKENDEKKEE